jgi:polyadenylate-binding protein
LAEIVAPGGLALPAAGIHAYYPEASRLASQQGQGTYDFIPPQPAGGMQPGFAPNFVVPYQMQRQGQKWQRKGAQRNGNLQYAHQNKVIIP